MDQKTLVEYGPLGVFEDDNEPSASLAPALRETSSTGLENQAAVRRYSEYCDKEERRRENGEVAMDFRYHELTTSGYRIVWTSGSYCRAQRDGVDVLLRWDGQSWVVL